VPKWRYKCAMEHLSTNQVTLLIAAATLLGGVVGWFGKGVGFLLTRWWTRAPIHERADYLNSVADLAAKLRAHGMSMEDVRQLEEVVRSPSITSSPAASGFVVQLSDEAGEPAAFQSNYAMKMRKGATYGVAEAKLHQALQDLKLLMGDSEWECIEKAQGHWEAYREALTEGARREYEGGTHAGLAAVLTAIAETERRADEIRAQVDERARR
jgi:uncharacterized protein YecT (DUF1311 family)